MLGDVGGLDGERNARGVEVDDGSREGLTDDDDRDVDFDLLALLDDDEVNVLDDLVYRVLLDILDQRQLGLASDVELDQSVRATNEQQHLVAGQRNVNRVGAVTVQHGGDLSGSAQTAGKTLAEVLAEFGVDGGVFRHVHSPWAGTGC